MIALSGKEQSANNAQYQLPDMQFSSAAQTASVWNDQLACTVGNTMQTNSAPLRQDYQPLYGEGWGVFEEPNMPNPVPDGNATQTNNYLLAWTHQEVDENMSDSRLDTDVTVTPLSANHPKYVTPRVNRSQFRPSVYQYKEDWGDTPAEGFQTSTFKNSHYNVSHYNNPNFQPEQWSPDEGDEKWRTQRKKDKET